MRERMRDNISATQASSRLKHGSGGIVDIEFMVQYLVLGWAAEFPSLLDFPDNTRILEQAGNCGLLGQNTAQQLIADYAALRHSGQLLAIGWINVPSTGGGSEVSSEIDSESDIERRRERVAQLWRVLMIEGRSPEELA